MNRRMFLRCLAALGGASAAAPLLHACSGAADERAATDDALATPTARQPTPVNAAAATETSAPTATEQRAMATVALVRTADRADGVRRALDLLSVNPVRGREVLLKPNYNSVDPAPGSTHEDVLISTLAALADMGARSVAVGDRSGMGDTQAVMRGLGVDATAQAFGARTIAFDSLPDDAWMMTESDVPHWSRGFPVPRMLADVDCVIQTCNLKTHRYGGHFTMSLKNSVGLVAKRLDGHDYMDELHGSPNMRSMIAETNTAYAPALVIVDGVDAFVSGGPATGTLASPRVVLAGTDRVALDAVGVAVLRLFGTSGDVARGTVFEQDQIARAVALGLGVSGPEQIAFATDDAEGDAFAARIRAVLAA